jgi:hypothetical protein
VDSRHWWRGSGRLHEALQHWIHNNIPCLLKILRSFIVTTHSLVLDNNDHTQSMQLRTNSVLLHCGVSSYHCLRAPLSASEHHHVYSAFRRVCEGCRVQCEQATDTAGFSYGYRSQVSL